MEPLILRIDHVSVAVRDYEKARHFFQDILGAIPGAATEDPDMKFVWQLFCLGDLSRFELMRATGEGGLLDNFLAHKEGGVHHITVQTPNIEKAKSILTQNGIPYFGYEEYEDDYWKAIYIHPRHAFGVLIQIAEFNAPDWLSDEVNLPAGIRWTLEKTEGGIRLNLAHPGGGQLNMDFTRDEAKKLIADLEAVSGQ
ncbi:MAG: VOC family protein [Deltaproteobacteria bacterium]|nr:VOC family protein [Deltaproteobacteria bacterium]